MTAPELRHSSVLVSKPVLHSGARRHTCLDYDPTAVSTKTCQILNICIIALETESVYMLDILRRPPTWSDKLMSKGLSCTLGFAGHRARVPPDPIPNSEVKPRSVSSCNMVFGHVNPEKLVTPLQLAWEFVRKLPKTYN